MPIPETLGGPNLFTLSGDNVTISLSLPTRAIDGRLMPPHLVYSGIFGNLSFSGDDIRFVPSVLGTLVSVTLKGVPDETPGPTGLPVTVALTLILPDVRLGLAEEHFATVAIETTRRTTSPGPMTGALQSYVVHALEGTAGAVIS